ncbi:collagen alpha-1(III) chain-like [Passer domesticus]|uniref:collagen alpha-1(III) chain-like n=1 Tax=Passer domesticus TaxID=48849 RepID=UPI0030FEC83E
MQGVNTGSPGVTLQRGCPLPGPTGAPGADVTLGWQRARGRGGRGFTGLLLPGPQPHGPGTGHGDSAAESPPPGTEPRLEHEAHDGSPGEQQDSGTANASLPGVTEEGHGEGEKEPAGGLGPGDIQTQESSKEQGQEEQSSGEESTAAHRGGNHGPGTQDDIHAQEDEEPGTEKGGSEEEGQPGEEQTEMPRAISAPEGEEERDDQSSEEDDEQGESEEDEHGESEVDGGKEESEEGESKEEKESDEDGDRPENESAENDKEAAGTSNKKSPSKPAAAGTGGARDSPASCHHPPCGDAAEDPPAAVENPPMEEDPPTEEDPPVTEDPPTAEEDPPAAEDLPAVAENPPAAAADPPANKTPLAGTEVPSTTPAAAETRLSQIGWSLFLWVCCSSKSDLPSTQRS